MNGYIDDVIENLTLEDLSFLGVLYDNGSNSKFKGITKKELQTATRLNRNAFENTTKKLLGTCFISKAVEFKTHKIYITNYGIHALEQSFEIEEWVE